MAIIGNGILDGFSGRVGPVVGYWRRGRWCVRAHVPHIRDARTEAQLVQRSRFKAMILFASPATAVLRLGLHHEADRLGLTEGNVFLRMNHSSFAPQGGGVDYAALRFSKGGLPNVDFLGAWTDDGRTARVFWTKNMLSARASNDDRVAVYAYCPALGQGVAVEAVRHARQLRFLMPDGWAAGEVHLWGFCVDRTGQASPTAYLGQLQAGEGPATAAPEGGGEDGESNIWLEINPVRSLEEKIFGQVENSS